VIDPSQSALKELLNRVIDYAGLFPPANLSLAEALHTFRRHRAEPTAWIVARLVLPVDALTQLTAADSATLGSFRISLIPRRVTTSADFTAALQSDLDRANAFLKANPPACLDTIEMLVPEDAARTQALPTLIAEAGRLVRGRTVFWEVPSASNFAEHLALLAEACRAAGPAAAAGEPPALQTPRWGLKLRTGGPRADSIPDSQTIAFALTLSRDPGLPIKFTAGLHHPIRSSVHGAVQHGFINVLMAALLNRHHQLLPDVTAKILDDDRADSFRFEPGYAAWRDLSIATETIRSLRSEVVSFGSCSVAEPLEDLRRLGWLTTDDTEGKVEG
jgi:hypothetical protein